MRFVATNPAVILHRLCLYGCLAALLAASPARGEIAAQSPDTTVSPARGGETPPDASPASPAERDGGTPSAIPLVKIPGEADATLDFLRMLRRDVDHDPVITPTMGQISTVSRAITDLSARTATLDLDRLSVRSLEGIRADWSNLRSRISSLGDQLIHREGALEDHWSKLQSESDKWRETRSSVTDAEPPAPVTKSIDAVLEEIDKARELLAEHIGRLTGLKMQVLDLKSVVDRSYEEVQEALERAHSRLFVAQEPPLWKLFAGEAKARSFRESSRESISWMRVGFTHFAQQYRPRIAAHLLLFVLLTIALYLVRNRARNWNLVDNARITVDRIARWPIPTAFLTIFAFTRIIYPGVPVVVADAIAILAIPMLMVLLPAVLPRALVRPAYVVFFLIIANRIASMFVVLGIVERVLQLALTLVAFAALLFWTRRSGPIAGLTPAARSTARAAARLAATLLAAAFVANVLGAISLAELLTTGTLVTAYIAVVVAVVARLLHALGHAVIGSPLARKLTSIRAHDEILKRRFDTLLKVTAVVAFALGALRWFSVLDPVASAVSKWLDRSWSVGSISVSPGAILAFFIAIGVSILVSRLVRAVLERDVLPRTSVGLGTTATFSLLIHYAIVALGFMVALAAAGIRLSQLAIVLGAFGIGIGFGLQTVVNNFISGLILIFERPIKVGDTIEVGTLLGTVQRIGIRASTVRTYAGAEVIVPNGNLLADQVVNWTLSDVYRRIDIAVGVAYGTDPSAVVKLLAEVAKSDARVLANPEPYALFLEFGDSSLNFEVRFWTVSEGWLRVKSDLTIAVHDAIVDAGIVIPFPQRDLHLRSVDPSVAGRFPGPTGDKPD